MVDVACKSAADALDACEAKAEKLGHGLPECYDTFSATGTLAATRANCIRSNCSKQCLRDGHDSIARRSGGCPACVENPSIE
jgi:hypothetical protein